MKYVVKRLLLFIPTIIGVSIVIFVILRIMPGDIAATILAGGEAGATFTEEQRQNLRKELGLDRPIHVQYLGWMWGLARFDLGLSYAFRLPISDELKRRLPVTLELALLTSIIITVISIPIGVLAAVYQDKWPDYILRGIATVGLSMPTFFVGLVFVLILSAYFSWLPAFGFVHLWEKPWTSFQQLIFPALALGFHSSGYIMRMARAQLLEVLRDDYIRTARAKGLSESAVILRHALRNALLPVVTLLGFQITFLLGGTIAVELIFGIPGMGYTLVNAVFVKDLPLVQAFVMYLTLVALVVNLLVDLSYSWLDPRIQYS